jgi:hypothetical protein
MSALTVHWGARALDGNEDGTLLLGRLVTRR